MLIYFETNESGKAPHIFQQQKKEMFYFTFNTFEKLTSF